MYIQRTIKYILLSKLSSYSRIRKCQHHKVSVLPASQVSAYTRDQCGITWKHPSVPELSELLTNCDAGPHSEKVLWGDKTELESRNVRETPFNTPGRQEQSREWLKDREVSWGRDVFHFIKCPTTQGRKGPFVLMLSQEHLKRSRFVEWHGSEDQSVF